MGLLSDFQDKASCSGAALHSEGWVSSHHLVFKDNNVRKKSLQIGGYLLKSYRLQDQNDA